MLYLDIFDKRYAESAPKSGILTPSDLQYLRRLYSFNRDSIQGYYHSRNFSVKNTNIISRILEHFPMYIGYDSYRYLEYSYNKNKYLAKHFKFTSEIETGIVHRPYFLGNSGDEFIYSEFEDFDVVDAVKNWKTINCIRFINSPRNDIKMLMPLGLDDGSKGGLAAIAINIPLLALKYREFIKEQMASKEESNLNKNHFVIKYVLANSLNDLADHSFLNRIMDTFYGNELYIPNKKYRFKTFEPTVQVDRYIDQTLDTITNKKLDYVNVLRNIKLPFSEDASDLLCVNDFGGSRQVKLSVVVNRLKHMKFLYDVNPDSRQMNKHYINDWKRLVSRIDRDSVSEQYSFSHEVGEAIKDLLYEISNY